MVRRQETEALLATRRELGPEYEAALVASFAEKVEQAIADRHDADVTESRREARAVETTRLRQFVLGIVSLGVGVPITIVPVASTGGEGLVAVLVGWAGIVGVNVAHGISVRSSSRRS